MDAELVIIEKRRRSYGSREEADGGDVLMLKVVDSSKLMVDKERKEIGVMVKGNVGVEDDAVPLGQGNKNLGKY